MRSSGAVPRRTALAPPAVDAETASIVVGLVSGLEMSQSTEEAFGHLAHAVESLGFGAIVYAAIPLTLRVTERISPVFLASESFSTGVLAHYERAGFASSDFTIERVLAGNVEPLDWHEEIDKGRLRAEQRESGIKCLTEHGSSTLEPRVGERSAAFQLRVVGLVPSSTPSARCRRVIRRS